MTPRVVNGSRPDRFRILFDARFGLRQYQLAGEGGEAGEVVSPLGLA